MKKVLLMLLVLCAFAGASAQNANRKGFFIEAAVGGSVGTPPVGGLSIQDGQLMAHYYGGAMLNLAFGPRFRTGDHTAFDFRISAQANASGLAGAQTLVVKAMPGIRISTGEIFRNMSLYFGANVGGALANRGSSWNVVPADGEVMHWSLFDEDVSGGVGYEVSFGVNVTTHLYAGFVWSAQYMFSQMRNPFDSENLHYGMAAFRLGYRF